ncbi:filamentous hemagglutinin N-terminal domain-containing protein [Campylobacter jejuni]|uniref:two-partner secretion domain-containing protein n=1 Tax=Campylobacter jejuni TaxID=197 RepID=UPI001BE19FA6|nr:filamentous hemagglutinin N-terminal domain-containing protein [Campylobacter jejuni]ECL6401979.1 filamentous hemagglutinin N-terminal domain-containing protein [Campylobacter jejuni]ECQ1419756.1 filamentous hemagglutinin N-terminal domain-containing protein [Campylobacter jejuni]UWN28095.1 hypothetical protein AEI25_04630 [Campylobacter jejuni]HBD2746892.1 filamentous hemagglutinin N-terminal domain-containing protein [Campylobacter jejuni]HBD2750551.1 filamentous hemagglutinin N-terminal 
MKKLNKLSLSLVVGSLLFTQSYALPSGGKFTHGTSGSISSSNGIMNITGNKQNSVIQWGGGFNIANGETVNFKGNGYNYLNIVYGSKSSHIDGKLEGGTNNIFLINPNGIVVGKDGSINANRVFLSASSIGDKEMQEFASSGKISAFDGDPRTISPVIKSNAGNVINLGTISVYDRVVMAGNQVSNIKYGSTDYGKFIFTKKGDARDIYLDVYTFNILVLAGAAKDIFKVSNSIRTPNIRPSKGITGPADSLVGIDKGYKETSDLITKDDISSEVINSIFNSLKFNSYANIDDIFTIYTDSELKNKLSEDILQSIDFMAALYGQASTNENAKLKEALSTSYENVEKAGKSINTVKNTLSQIAKTTEEQKNTQKAYDDALNNYNTIVELYNKALKIGDSKVLETLKTEMNSKYIVLQQATTALKDATSSNNSNLETNKQTIASASIDNYKLTVNGQYSANLKDVSKPNDNNSGSNNGNDGADSGDINNGNNNGSNNNPNDTIGQQEPDIATALLMQTTDEDPNINEDDKQASIDEASTQESGNACIVSDNFKAGNPCSR